MSMKSLLDIDHNESNILIRLAELEDRIATLESFLPSGLFPSGTLMVLPGQLSLNSLDTETFKIVDAGSAGATQQDWVEVEVGGITGYLHVYAAT